MNALGLLSARNMAATFYIDSGFIGDPTHLAIADLRTLYTSGNEIGGSHDRSRQHQEAERRRTLGSRCARIATRCWAGGRGDLVRVPLRVLRRRLGSSSTTAATTAAEESRASTTPRRSPRRSPPLDPYGLRMTPSIKQGTTVATVEGYVTAAEAQEADGSSS